MIARWNGKRPCGACGKPILEGQEITGGRGNWVHAECINGAPVPAPAPAVQAVASSNGNGPRLRNPGAPMNAAQRRFIGTLLDEREFTMAEASTLIDFLKAKPKKQAARNDLAARLAA